jgi:hypothetical protein
MVFAQSFMCLRLMNLEGLVTIIRIEFIYLTCEPLGKCASFSYLPTAITTFTTNFLMVVE